MTTIEIKDASGKKAGDAELSASVFGIEPNVPVMHQVVRAQRAVLACRHQQHPHPRPGPRRRQEAVAPEGHRPCPPGLHPLPSVGWRRYRVRSASAQLRLPREQQGSQAGHALRSVRQGGRRSSSPLSTSSTSRSLAPRSAKAVHQGPGLARASAPRWSSATTTSTRGCPSATWRRSTSCRVAEANTYELLDNKAAGVHR